MSRANAGAPAWVLRANGVPAFLDIDPVNNRAWNNAEVSIASLLTCTRASTGYYTNAAGLLSSVAINTLRYGDIGLLVEEARTNVVLWNRDLTNAAWVAVNVTAAKDQTGPDGASNSASSITASAGNGTILQAIVLASSARFQTTYVKRITGTGVINMTMDAGLTWTAVTVTGAWTRVSIPTQTLANPTVGFQIVTSGDAIAVDLVQNENGAFATSPIPTTTTSVARAADVVVDASNLSQWYNNSGGSFYVQYAADTALVQDIFGVDDTTFNNAIGLYHSGGVNHWARVGGVNQANFAMSAAVVSASKAAFADRASDSAGSYNGAVVGTGSGTVPAPTRLKFGKIGGGVSGASNVVNIKRFAHWTNIRLSNVSLVALTT